MTPPPSLTHTHTPTHTHTEREREICSWNISFHKTHKGAIQRRSVRKGRVSAWCGGRVRSMCAYVLMCVRSLCELCIVTCVRRGAHLCEVYVCVLQYDNECLALGECGIPESLHVCYGLHSHTRTHTHTHTHTHTQGHIDIPQLRRQPT